MSPLGVPSATINMWGRWWEAGRGGEGPEPLPCIPMTELGDGCASREHIPDQWFQYTAGSTRSCISTFIHHTRFKIYATWWDATYRSWFTAGNCSWSCVAPRAYELSMPVVSLWGDYRKQTLTAEYPEGWSKPTGTWLCRISPSSYIW